MRIAILKDHEKWAQAAHAEGLKKYAPSWVKVSTHLLGTYDHDAVQAQAVYVINLGSCFPRGNARMATCVASHAWMHTANDPADWRTRGVNPRRNAQAGERHLHRADVVICRNTALEQWAMQHHPNARYIPVGIDPEIFHPAGRIGTHGRYRLRVGWCGQINPEREGHFKGYYEVWEPLKAKVGDRYAMLENTNTAESARPWAEMADWFRSLDVFVTTATAEGTPNPPFQAAACGTPVISTDVGQVSDWAALRKEGLIVPSYGNAAEAAQVVDLIAAKLEELEDSHDRYRVSETLLQSIEREYSYKVLAEPTLAFICGTP